MNSSTTSTPVNKNYLALVLRGTLWNSIQYILNSSAAFVTVYLLTRYFDQPTYGIYSYLLWMMGLIPLIANFGLTTTLQTFIPKYYFGNQVPQALSAARRLLKIQVSILATFMIFFVALLPYWHVFVSFRVPQFTTILSLIFVAGCVQVMNTFFMTYHNALQHFKMTSLVTAAGAITNFVSIALLVHFNAPLMWFFIPLLGVYIAQSLFYLFSSRLIFQAPTIFDRDFTSSRLLRFSFLAYANILLQTVVWDKSELFFLAKFHNSSQLAIYSIGYTVSLTILALFDPFIQVLTNILSEVVSNKDQSRIKIILDKSARFMAMCILPMMTLLFFFGPFVFEKFFGPEYDVAGRVAAWLLFSAGLSRMFAAAWAIPTYMFDMKTVVRIEILLSIVNLGLGLLIIPRFGYIGATIVNVTTQVLAWLVFAVYIRKFHVRILTRAITQIFSLNIIVFGILALLFHFLIPVELRIAITILIAGLYYITLQKMFTDSDKVFLRDIFRRVPIFNRLFRSTSIPI